MKKKSFLIFLLIFSTTRLYAMDCFSKMINDCLKLSGGEKLDDEYLKKMNEKSKEIEKKSDGRRRTPPSPKLYKTNQSKD